MPQSSRYHWAFRPHRADDSFGVMAGSGCLPFRDKVSEATISADQPSPVPPRAPRPPARHAAKLAVWVLGIPSVLVLLLYIVLLITPIQLPFAGQAVRGFVQSLIPPTSRIEMGNMALALEGGIWPVIQFAPVELDDTLTGARVAMEALEVGFSPARALFGSRAPRSPSSARKCRWCRTSTGRASPVSSSSTTPMAARRRCACSKASSPFPPSTSPPAASAARAPAAPASARTMTG